MDITKDSWSKEEYNIFLKYLYQKKDTKFKEFSKKIILDETIIGVRTPILKKISKEIFKGNYKSYLEVSSDNTYEEKLIYGLIVGNIKEFNEETIKYVNNYSKMINNWALCDLFCSNLKFVKKNKQEVLKYINKKIKNKNTWMKRLCFVLLLDYYVEEEYLPLIFELCDTYNTSDYYVEMSVAWLISICYIKYKKQTKKYLNKNKLNNFTYNKAIQKIIESKRITNEEKNILRKMKRGDKNENRNCK